MLTNLLGVDDALQQILSAIDPLPSEVVDLDQAFSRVLAEDVSATMNLPPFANSSMDGFAVHAADIADASTEFPVRLRVVMDIPAGSIPPASLQRGQAARIMTGAPLPEGADTVVPVEDTDGTWVKGDSVAVPESIGVYRRVEVNGYVRLPGEDIAKGTQVLSVGTLLRAQEVGMLATLGYANVRVVRKPRVAVLSSGDELLRAGDSPAPGKIYDANRYTISGLVRAFGGEPIILPPARDTLASVRNLFTDALSKGPDMIITSGGASVGTADFIHTVLSELGEVSFWKINLRPGKPLAFGSLNGVPFFGLPGNPVSAMVTFEVLVRPAILKLAGRAVQPEEIEATLDQVVQSDGRRSFLRVRLSLDHDEHWHATTTGTQSSGALMSMVLADGLMIVPEGVKEVPQGEKLRVRLLRPLAEIANRSM